MSARRAISSAHSYPEHSLQIALYTLTPFYVLAIVLFLWLARVLRTRGQQAGGTVR